MQLFDNHNHSQFSFDGGRTDVEKSSVSALKKGLSGICFTDHCDFYVPERKERFEKTVTEEFDIPAQQAEIDRVGEMVSDRLRIFKGIELGLHRNSREKIRNTLVSHSFDQVTASVHYIDDTDPFFGGYYEGKDWKTAYRHYLETIYEEISWLGDFDVLGHYDYIARYAPYPQTSILYRDFGDVIDAILSLLAEGGKALEINTKTYQDYNGRTPVQDMDILLRFRELGGEAVSLGSDSHDADRIGHRLDYFAEMLKSAGFRYSVHFENRKPVLTSLL